MVQRGDCRWAVDTYKMAVDTVARGAVEATGMQIQFISTLIPDKMCLLAYFLPVGLKAASLTLLCTDLSGIPRNPDFLALPGTLICSCA